MANDNKCNYDPEVEKEAIAAEEAYKQKNGHYREGSAYNKAQELEAIKNGGPFKRELKQKFYSKPLEKIDTPKIEPLKSKHTGVRRNLNGEVIGEYKMR